MTDPINADASLRDSGKYRMLAELGEGGTAIVHLAVARGPSGFNKLVVLKGLKRALAEDPEMRRMFLQEARVAARLNHPCIVQTNEVADFGRGPVIIMEYLEGQSLLKLLQAKGTLTLAMHLRILADTAGALHYAHELADFDGKPIGLVHRDVSPHNVFVTYGGQTKLLDFGIAKLTGTSTETQSGLIKGKLRYMAPEQIAGDTIDRRADVFSVGVMLWEAVTGESMWQGCSDATVMHRVLNGELVEPRAVKSDIPARLNEICMKALAESPDARYATAAEIEAALEEVIDGLGTRVSAREIGKAVTAAFSEVREKTKVHVETQLSKVASLSLEEYEAMETTALSVALGPDAYRGVEAAPIDETARSARRRALLGIGVGGLLALLGLGGFIVRGRGPIPVAQAVQAPAAPSASSAPAPAAPVSIRISATPASAKLSVDGTEVPSNPFVREFVVDGAPHLIQAEAEGYAAGSVAFVADQDRDVVVDLVPAKTPAADKGRGRASSTVPTIPATVTPAPAPTHADCNPPYRIDSSGVKKFKLECL